MKTFSVNMLPFIWKYIVPILTIMMYIYVNNYSDESFNSLKYSVKHSSVWCKTSLNSQKLCRFKNICYDPQVMSFVFFLDNLSVIKGLSNYEELQTVQLSSINSHNKFEANLSVVNSEYYKIQNVEFVEKALLFSRFKPDNIMHVIHDDLIPVFLTLEEICLGNITFCEKNYRLIIHDNYPEGSYFNFYRIFSTYEPVILTQLNKSKSLCFAELHMGLVQDSIFYQYGFKQLQGPVKDLRLNHTDIIRFVSHVQSKLNIKSKYNNRNYIPIVLVDRKKTRRILNVKSLADMLKKVYKSYHPEQKIKLITLDLMENRTDLFLQELAQASALVGMHGAEMIFSLFLKSNSTVIELFPYGVQPEVVSFVKPLVKLKGIHFSYISWTNQFRNLSVFHPEADQLHGGISFLPLEVQDKIKNVQKVPAVECCNNPIYLYFMYQDTWIDSTFENFLMRELEKNVGSLMASQLADDWFFPSTVSNVICSYDSVLGHLHISWMPPFNIKAESLLYDVILLETYSNFKKKILTNNTTLLVRVSSNEATRKFQVWICAISQVNNAKSKDFFRECV